MIRYALVCGNGHAFEGWFASGADFDRQSERGLLSCPHCGDETVAKGLMAPSIGRRAKENVGAAPPAIAAAETPKPGGPVAMPDERTRELIARIRELRKAVNAQTEDVGERFGEEARKIHYGEAESRAIRGQAPWEEAVRLIEEGIEVMPIPDLPDDLN